MANNFKKVIDRQMWVQVTPTPNAHAAGMGLTSDLRNDASRNPYIYQLTSATVLNRFNIVQKGWDSTIVNPGLGGTFGAGAGAVFVPSFALMGAIGNGCTTSSIVTTTTIAAVGANMLSNRGGSGEYGYKIRIIGKVSGKTEERWIIGNTAGTTPTITLDIPLTFIPANGDSYEILSGRVLMLSAGALAATIFRSFEVATNALASLTNTGLPATISTEFSSIALDEQYVPYNHKPGEGFLVGAGTYDLDCSCGPKRCLIATASGPSSLTGQATGGDVSVLENEYRNFQIRIVEDTAEPTAVGQRRIIASHTAGASPVYTLGSAWTVQPSATAKYVIEYPNLLLLWSSATAVTYTYNYTNATLTNGTTSMGAGTWSTAFFGNRGGVIGVGCTTFGSFGIQPDPAKNARHSFVFSFRGSSSTLDVLDIAGGTTGVWSNAVVYDGTRAVAGGTCGKYAPYDNEGRFGYMNIYVASATNQIYRFDVKNRVLQTFTPTDWIQAGTAAAGDRLATYCAIDGSDKYSVILLVAHLSSISQEIIVQV